MFSERISASKPRLMLLLLRSVTGFSVSAIKAWDLGKSGVGTGFRLRLDWEIFGVDAGEVGLRGEWVELIGEWVGLAREWVWL